MNKSKLTLIIDGNWLLMSRLFPLTCNGINNEEEFPKELQTLLFRSINLVLKTFPSIDNIIFCSDGGSWRNSIELPSFIDEEYKGNREKDESLPWDTIFETFEEFSNILKNNGIKVCHEYGVEGDDWCWYWSKRLNKEKTNVILWTRDHDVMQLVHTDNDGFFTVWWNKDDGVIAEDVSNSEMDYLFNTTYNNNETLLYELINNSKQIKYINPKEIYIDKIIRGDAGDNILPIITKNAKTRIYKVSRKDIDNTLNVFNDNDIKTYLSNLIELKTYNGKINETLNNIIEHFNYNKRLVVLDESVYPNDIKNIFIECDLEEIEPNANLSIIESEINAKNNELFGIIENI